MSYWTVALLTRPYIGHYRYSLSHKPIVLPAGVFIATNVSTLVHVMFGVQGANQYHSSADFIKSCEELCYYQHVHILNTSSVLWTHLFNSMIDLSVLGTYKGLNAMLSLIRPAQASTPADHRAAGKVC